MPPNQRLKSEDLPALPGYTILSTAGMGAGSIIYKARRDATGELVAMKVVHRQNDPEGKFFEQIESEYHVGHLISHPHVRQVYELHRIRRRWRTVALCLIMEYLDGQELDQADIADLKQLLPIFARVARGLRAMHRAGFVHADIKPNNVMVANHKHVKVFDLGQSCKLGSVKPRIQGTPDFIAPEQVMRLPLSERTDVFNLGTTMYWCLTGRKFPTRIRSQQKAGAFDIGCPREAQTPQECNPEIPAILSNLVMDCCRNGPANRPADMDEVLRRLRAVVQASHIIRK